jgi:hypothetical protein
VERFTFHEFHDDELVLAGFAALVVRHDIGVVEAAGRLRFAFEAALDLFAFGGFEAGVEAEDFYGDIAGHFGIMGSEDDTHAAASEFLEDFEAP